MELLLNGRSVLGLPTNIPPPKLFSCLVCMHEKQQSLEHGSVRESPLKVIGKLLYMAGLWLLPNAFLSRFFLFFGGHGSGATPSMDFLRAARPEQPLFV